MINNKSNMWYSHTNFPQLYLPMMHWLYVPAFRQREHAERFKHTGKDKTLFLPVVTIQSQQVQ